MWHSSSTSSIPSSRLAHRIFSQKCKLLLLDIISRENELDFTLDWCCQPSKIDFLKNFIYVQLNSKYVILRHLFSNGNLSSRLTLQFNKLLWHHFGNWILHLTKLYTLENVLHCKVLTTMPNDFRSVKHRSQFREIESIRNIMFRSRQTYRQTDRHTD